MCNIRKLLAFSLLATLFAGCAKEQTSQSKSAGLVPVRYATIGVNEASIPLYLGIKKGFYAEQGVDLKIISFDGGVESVTAGAAGEIEIGGVGSPIVVGAAAGVPIKIVGSPVAPGQHFVLVTRPNYTRFEELKGKAVSGGRPGQGTIQAFATIAKAHNLKVSDFQNENAGFSSAAIAALQAGKVEAVLTTELPAAKAELEGFGKILERAEKYFGRYQHTYFFATDRFIAQRPEAVRGFLAGYRKSVEYVKTHPDEALRFGVEELKLDEKPLKRILAEQLPSWDATGQVDLVGTNNAIKILRDLGELDKSVQVTAEQIVDQRFLSK